MDGGLWQLATTAFREREAFQAVRQELHEEVVAGGKRLSERQRELVGWQQVDFVPTFAGIGGGCAGIMLLRRLGVMATSHKLAILLPALPFYVFPYQATYYVRDARYLIEMMRETETAKFARRLRRVYEESAPPNSAVLEELDSGAEISS
eukprot:TRINITY_DN26155_c0_g1_i1.p1 TRINITY_DN26155_c0_g1~~TRINITY_DN26155_c0_g1_i1.p1  ORF type:complete len:166 (+),score=41.49 TRINITY_DN26155_c0_g1_i1:51-500(+)